MGFAAVMAKAAGLVIHDVFGIPIWVAIILVAIMTTLYTSFGGLQASVMTDALQFVLFTILMPAILLFTLFVPLRDGAAALTYELKAATAAGFQSTSWVQIVGLVIAFLLGETLIPPYANRALATRTTSASRNSFVLAGLFSTVWFTVMISLGIVARAIVPAGTGEDSVLLTMVKTIMPTEGYAMLLVALLSVIISSLDSLMNAGAVTFTQDIVKPFVRVSDGASLICGRLATVAIAAVAGVAAMAVPRIVTGLLMCYTVWAPAMLPTAVLGLWLKRPRPLAGILSMVTGAAVALSLQFIWHYTPEDPTILLALAAAIVAYVIGHFLSPFFVEPR
jgi:SSS family solute:Na+ symporter